MLFGDKDRIEGVEVKLTRRHPTSVGPSIKSLHGALRLTAAKFLSNPK